MAEACFLGRAATVQLLIQLECVYMLTDCSGGRRETAVMKALVTTALSHVSCLSLSYYLCDFPLDLRVYLNQLQMCLLSV